MMRAMGRPPQDDKTRDVTIEFRCMLEQRDAYDAAADLAGMVRSEWMRARLDEAAERETRGQRVASRSKLNARAGKASTRNDGEK